MAPRINLKLSRSELAKLVNSYFALGDFLEEIVGPEQLYSSSFIKGMRDALSEHRKGHTKRIRNVYDLIS